MVEEIASHLLALESSSKQAVRYPHRQVHMFKPTRKDYVILSTRKNMLHSRILINQLQINIWQSSTLQGLSTRYAFTQCHVPTLHTLSLILQLFASICVAGSLITCHVRASFEKHCQVNGEYGSSRLHLCFRLPASPDYDDKPGNITSAAAQSLLE